MGKGDKKSKRGKIVIGSFGVRRPRRKKKAVTRPVKTKSEPKIREPRLKEEKKVAPAEPVLELQFTEAAEVAEKKTVKKSPAKKPAKKAGEETVTPEVEAEVKPKAPKAKKKTDTEPVAEAPKAEEPKQE